MPDRDILDEPWRIVLLGLAFILAVFLPAGRHAWPLLGLGGIIAGAGWYLEWSRRRSARSKQIHRPKSHITTTRTPFSDDL